MSGSKYTAPALAVAGILGGGVYLAGRQNTPSHQSNDTSPKSQSQSVDLETQKRREQSDARRDLGLGGAGVGQNSMTGGTELGSGLKPGNTENPKKETTNPGTSRDNLPQGGVGGGPGGGQSNASSIEKKGHGVADGKSSGPLSSLLGGSTGSTGGDGQSTGAGESKMRPNSNEGSGSGPSGGEKQSLSQSLQGVFGQGGPSAGTGDFKDPKDTRVKSHHADTPTNRGGSPHDKHRKDVTAVSKTSE